MEKLHNVTGEQSLLLICNGCGESVVYGYVNIGEELIYIPHLISGTLHINKEMQSQEGKFFEILIDAGIKVPMLSGQDANSYDPCSGFYDTACHEMVTRNKLSDLTGDMHCNEKSMDKRHTVDMNNFIKNNIDKIDLLEDLAKSYHAGFDWTGTPYDTKH